MSLILSRTRIVGALVVGLVLVGGAACGGGDQPSTPTPGPQVQSKTTSQSGQAPKAPAHTEHTTEIDQQDMTFTPARVSVKVGETVLIKNSETTIHTANINGKNITGNMKKGDSTAWTATAAGEYKVSCDYHPQMSATISVS